MALKEALAWAEDKQLSDLDYRFLKASQQLTQQKTEQNLLRAEIEREKAQFALFAVKEANRILAIARQNAHQKIKQLRLSPRWLSLVAIAVALFTILLRLTGGLQGLELTALDLYFQQRRAELDSRITMITIDETDIQNIGQFPLSDLILARSLDNLIRYQPRVIGLNLYRDLPVPPGNELLQQLLKTTPNLIGIEKVVGAKISPPPLLAKSNRVGFADRIFDDDGAIRRALLSIRDDNGIEYSFALRLVLEYLQAENITPQPLANTASHIQLGKTILIPFQPNDGGYVRADAGGYQTLIDYRGTLDRFTHYSLSALLADRIPEEVLRDRLILIGSTAATMGDLSLTPYSRWKSTIGNQMAGVTIEANIISQLLSAALDRESMLRTSSPVREALYLLLAAGVGAFWGWWLRSFWHRAIAISCTVIATILITYLTFLQGWWLPVIPMAIALIVAAMGIVIVTQRQLATMQLKETVKHLIVISRSQLIVRNIALELLKQGESPKDRELIEKFISH